MIRRPVSSVCPSCGSADHSFANHSELFTLMPDRICRGCAARYAPPTPVWLAVLALVTGLVCLPAGGVLLLWVADPASGDAAAGTAALALMFVAAGVILLVGAVRGLMEDSAGPWRGFPVLPPGEATPPVRERDAG